jgi:hypothetical protein
MNKWQLLILAHISIFGVTAVEEEWENWNWFWVQNFQTENCFTGCLDKYTDNRYCRDFGSG